MNTIINNKNLNTESKKIDYSKSNYKNKDNIKLDSNGDEIVWEAKHNLSWWDYIMYSIVFFWVLLWCVVV